MHVVGVCRDGFFLYNFPLTEVTFRGLRSYCPCVDELVEAALWGTRSLLGNRLVGEEGKGGLHGGGEIVLLKYHHSFPPSLPFTAGGRELRLVSV